MQVLYPIVRDAFLLRGKILSSNLHLVSLARLGAKEAKSLTYFKEKIETWKTGRCPDRLCKHFIGQFGFVWKHKQETPFRSILITIFVTFLTALIFEQQLIYMVYESKIRPELYLLDLLDIFLFFLFAPLAIAGNFL